MTLRSALLKIMFDTVGIYDRAEEARQGLDLRGQGSALFTPKEVVEIVTRRFIRECKLALDIIDMCLEVEKEFDDDWHPIEGLCDVHFALQDVGPVNGDLGRLNISVLHNMAVLLGPDATKLPRGLTGRILNAAKETATS